MSEIQCSHDSKHKLHSKPAEVLGNNNKYKHPGQMEECKYCFFSGICSVGNGNILVVVYHECRQTY